MSDSGCLLSIPPVFNCLVSIGQLEAPDPWLNNENPWEIVRLDVTVPVRFYGHAERVGGAKGKGVVIGGQEVLAVAYDCPIPGYNTKNTSNIRFWSVRPFPRSVSDMVG